MTAKQKKLLMAGLTAMCVLIATGLVVKLMDVFGLTVEPEEWLSPKGLAETVVYLIGCGSAVWAFYTVNKG